MAESATAELKALAGDEYVIVAGGEAHRVSRLRVRQLGQLFERSEKLLPLIAARADELQENATGLLSELAVENEAECRALLEFGTEIPAAVIDEMTVEEFIAAIGIFLRNNPLFFSRVLRKLALLLVEAGRSPDGSTTASDSSAQDTGTATS